MARPASIGKERKIKRLETGNFLFCFWQENINKLNNSFLPLNSERNLFLGCQQKSLNLCARVILSGEFVGNESVSIINTMTILIKVSSSFW